MKSLGWRTIIATFWDFRCSWWDLIRGMWTLSHIKEPTVTVFGGMRAATENLYFQQATAFAQLCSENNIAVITGGGPGIMEAANCGAQGKTLGIGVRGVDSTFLNPCAKVLIVRHFFVRKWLFALYSSGVVVFPGGIGTVDELFDLLNHLKHKRLDPLPLILIGTAYWQPLLTWFTESALAQGFIKAEYINLFFITDDVHEAFERIRPEVKKAG